MFKYRILKLINPSSLAKWLNGGIYLEQLLMPPKIEMIEIKSEVVRC